MEEWLRFSVCFWHSFRGTGKQIQFDSFALNFNAFYLKGTDPFGQATIKRSWDDGTETMDNYKRRLEAAFEFFTKLGNDFR
jgi:xylose isomerase